MQKAKKIPEPKLWYNFECLFLKTHLVDKRLSLRFMASELNIEVHRVNLTS